MSHISREIHTKQCYSTVFTVFVVIVTLPTRKRDIVVLCVRSCSVTFGNGACSGRVALGAAYELRKHHNIDALVGLPCSVG